MARMSEAEYERYLKKFKTPEKKVEKLTKSGKPRKKREKKKHLCAQCKEEIKGAIVTSLFAGDHEFCGGNCIKIFRKEKND